MRVSPMHWLVSVQLALVRDQWSLARERLAWMPSSLGPSLNCSHAACHLLCKNRHRFSLWWLANDGMIVTTVPIWTLMRSAFHGICPSRSAKWFFPAIKRRKKTFRYIRFKHSSDYGSRSPMLRCQKLPWIGSSQQQMIVDRAQWLADPLKMKRFGISRFSVDSFLNLCLAYDINSDYIADTAIICENERER